MTSQKTITSNGRRVCFVEVPEDTTPHYSIQENNILLTWQSDIHYTELQLPDGNWKILGDSMELTEEQMREICENNGLGCWNNYKGIPDNKFTCLSVTESYASLKEANGIVDSNPLPKPMLTEHSSVDNFNYFHDMDTWEEAQSKVKRFVVLIEEKN